MSIALDTSLVLAIYDSRDRWHAAACHWLERVDEDLVATPLVVAELDFMIQRPGGNHAQQLFYEDLDAGVWGVRWWADALTETLAIARKYPFAGLADASLVALSGLLRTHRIATFDQHFRSMTTPRGEPFVLLPADA